MDHIHQRRTPLRYVDDQALLRSICFPVAAFPKSPTIRSQSTGDLRNRRLKT